MRIGPCILFVLLFVRTLASAQANSSPKLETEDRAFIASKVDSLVRGYFYSSKDLPRSALDASYKAYLRTALASDDRRQFDLATIEFVAQLHDGHTFFWDSLLDNSNQPLGFYAAPFDGFWVIQTTFLAVLKPGDVIVRIDNTPIEVFFQQQERYISASRVAAQHHNLFLLPYLFPEQFTLTLANGRSVTIDRERLKVPEQKADGRWLRPGATAYIRIPAFFNPFFEERALDFVQRFQHAKTLIIDVRNNGGGIQPKRLIQALMDRPYREWKASATARIPLIDFRNEGEKNKNSKTLPEFLRVCKYSADDHRCSLQLTWGGGVVDPASNAFHGRVILLVDGGCVSACEELVEPFKDSGRGTLVGETTEGSSGLPYLYDFHNGMKLTIAVKRQYFPDGSGFEGVGIKPDVEVRPTIEDVKSGRDPVLEKALELAANR